MTEDDLDRIIDDVAREMTSAPPDARFAHRVSTRIAGLEAPRERSRRLRAWILVPAAGVCVLLLAVFVARDVRLKPDATPDGTPVATPDIRTARATTAHAPAATPTVVTPTVASGFSRTTDRRTTDGRTTDGRTTVNPQPAFPPIDVDSLEIAPLARSEAIEINPIAIDRIEIAAMP